MTILLTIAATAAAFALGISIACYIKITAVVKSVTDTLEQQSQFNNSILSATNSNTKAISEILNAVEITQKTISTLLQ